MLWRIYWRASLQCWVLCKRDKVIHETGLIFRGIQSWGGCRHVIKLLQRSVWGPEQRNVQSGSQTRVGAQICLGNRARKFTQVCAKLLQPPINRLKAVSTPCKKSRCKWKMHNQCLLLIPPPFPVLLRVNAIMLDGAQAQFLMPFFPSIFVRAKAKETIFVFVF